MALPVVPEYVRMGWKARGRHYFFLKYGSNASQLRWGRKSRSDCRPKQAIQDDASWGHGVGLHDVMGSQVQAKYSRGVRWHRIVQEDSDTVRGVSGTHIGVV